MRYDTKKMTAALCLAVFVIAAAYASGCLLEDWRAKEDYSWVADSALSQRPVKVPEEGPEETDDGAQVFLRFQEPEGGYRGLPSVDEEWLLSVNPDYAAWLCIPELSISLPVTYSEEGGKYLRTTFTGQRNSAGCLFFDCCAEPFAQPNTVIHGHNMRDGAMFGTLKKLLSVEYEDQTVSAYVCADGKWHEYRLISVYTVKKNDRFPYRAGFPDRAGFSAYVEESLERSSVRYGVTERGDRLMTLSTCHAERMLIVQLTGPF